MNPAILCAQPPRAGAGADSGGRVASDAVSHRPGAPRRLKRTMDVNWRWDTDGARPGGGGRETNDPRTRPRHHEGPRKQNDRERLRAERAPPTNSARPPRRRARPKEKQRKRITAIDRRILRAHAPVPARGGGRPQGKMLGNPSIQRDSIVSHTEIAVRYYCTAPSFR